MLPLCKSSDEILNLFEAPQPEAEVKIQKPAAKKPRKKKPKKPMAPLDATRYEMWLQHRDRVAHSVSNTDSSPPIAKMVPKTRMNMLTVEADHYMQRTKDNLQMLVGLSTTMRTHGVINPFRYSAAPVVSGIPAMLVNLDRIEQDNLDMGRRIISVVSEVETGEIRDQRPSQQTQPFPMPNQALAKYEPYNLKIPTTDKERWQLFRPRVFFDLYLKDTRPLGRFVVELYTEAAPVVVLEMVRACMGNNHNGFAIKRLFPGLWMDVDLPLGNDSPLARPLEYDGKIIDNGANCVLSFSKAHLQGFRGSLAFSVSFKPLSVANGSRIGFGRVVKGCKMFDCIQAYGTKNGTVSRGLIFTSCGVL